MAKEESGGGGGWGSFPTLEPFVGSESKRKKRNKGRKEKHRRKRKIGGKREREVSRHFDGRISTVRELKSVHATRATRGYQNLGVLSNFKR